MKYTKPYKRGNRLFRFNLSACLVEWIEKPTAKMYADNTEWQESFGKDLWDIVDGYVIVETVGLNAENWKNKESRNEYLDVWNDELDEESAYLAHQYIMYG